LVAEQDGAHGGQEQQPLTLSLLQTLPVTRVRADMTGTLCRGPKGVSYKPQGAGSAPHNPPRDPHRTPSDIQMRARAPGPPPCRASQPTCAHRRAAHGTNKCPTAPTPTPPANPSAECATDRATADAPAARSPKRTTDNPACHRWWISGGLPRGVGVARVCLAARERGARGDKEPHESGRAHCALLARRAAAARIPGGGGHTRLAAEGISLGVAARGAVDRDPAGHTRPPVNDLQRPCAASPPPQPHSLAASAAWQGRRTAAQSGQVRDGRPPPGTPSPTPPARHRRSPEQR